MSNRRAKPARPANRRWTAPEDELLRRTYPDYGRMRAALPQRSMAALKHRVRTLGIAPRRHVWTNRQVARLLQLFRQGASDGDVLAAFPGMRLGQLKSKARHCGAPARRPAPIPFGDPALDAIRLLAFRRGLSLVALDRILRTGRYYQKSRRDPRLAPILRAAALFGAGVRIEWD